MNGRHAFIVGVLGVAALCFIVWLLIYVDGSVSQEIASSREQRDQWSRWSSEHCRIIGLTSSGTGMGRSETVAYRCDDNREYLSQDGYPPRGWAAR